MSTVPPVIDAETLGRWMVDERPLVLADVRWYLDGRSGRAAFEDGHLPGAVWIDVDRDLSRDDLPATEGRHPLPEPAAFAAAMGRYGIGDDTRVVAYDDTGGSTAGRLVLMLRWLGRDAALLDGGLGVWDAPPERGPGVAPATATFTPSPWPPDAIATVDEVAALAGAPRVVVLDARAPERFTGQVAVADPRPGHIPAARNAPWAANLDATGRLRPADELTQHYHHLGVAEAEQVIAYCGSGVSACLDVLAMEHAGLPRPRLFVASWSGWASDPTRPAATGS
jgi:thiosulfate/3-mercaptopyruvate sulfurtransferase